MVSEIMLQQTQVDRVIPKYNAFLNRFPTAKRLAEASPAEVITLWSGLGYNRRAIYLHRAAQQIVTQKSFPTSTIGLTELAGIGPYTASAILAFAYHQDVPVVDTNIRRIFSRYFFNGKGTLSGIEQQVGSSVPRGKGTDWNNALMDFGSMICMADQPACSVCVLRKTCTAFQQGNTQHYLRIAPPQSKFEGSRRQIRGRVLKLLKDASNGGLSFTQFAHQLEKPIPLISEIISEMKKEGLTTVRSARVSLPQKKTLDNR